MLQLRTEFLAMGCLLSQLKPKSNSEALIEVLVNSLKTLHGLLVDLRTELMRLDYPYDHAKGPITVGAYCVREMPQANDLWGVHQAASDMLDSYASLYVRLAGELIDAAERVEKLAQLPPLSPSAAEGEATPAASGNARAAEKA
jgi:hypothetical protein